MNPIKKTPIVLIATCLLITSVLTAPLEDTQEKSDGTVGTDNQSIEPESGDKVPKNSNSEVSTELPDFTSYKNTSTFSCYNRITGYYADVKLGCRVYHFCTQLESISETTYQRMSYICLDGSVFDQKDVNCVKEADLKVPCDKAEEEYERSNKQFDTREEAQPSMSDNLAANLMMNPLTRFIAGR